MRSLPTRHFWLGYVIVGLTVAGSYAIWLAAMAWSDSWYDDVWLYPAKVGSHGTLTLMCWAIIMAARLRPIEWMFGGLDKLYRAHRRIGELSFALIFLHPIFLAVSYADDVTGFFEYLWFSESWVRNTGIIALAAFALLVALSIFIKIPYHRWKRSHDFFGVLLVFVVYHAIIAEGEIVQLAPLTYWHGFWVAAALVCYVHIRLLYRFFGPLYDYVTEEVREIGDNVTEVLLAPAGRRMRYMPGQFVYVSFNSTAVSEEPHPISISSAPDAIRLRLSVKGLGDWTSTLPELNRGEPARIWGPYGRFAEMLLERPDLPVVLVGGGIGITPFLSIVASAEFRQRLADSTLIYSVPQRDAAIYHEELSHYAAPVDHMRYLQHISDEEGYIDADYLAAQLSRPLQHHIFLVCGPPPMMSSFKDFLQEAGVLRKQIRMEEFATG